MAVAVVVVAASAAADSLFDVVSDLLHAADLCPDDDGVVHLKARMVVRVSDLPVHKRLHSGGMGVVVVVVVMGWWYGGGGGSGDGDGSSGSGAVCSSSSSSSSSHPRSYDHILPVGSIRIRRWHISDAIESYVGTGRMRNY